MENTMANDIRTIGAMRRSRVNVQVPGSKSYTHRMVTAAALAQGTSLIENSLDAEDTRLTVQGLIRLGARIEAVEKGLSVQGVAGVPRGYDKPIFLGNSGTSMRFLTGVAALGFSEYTLTGSVRMQERPVQDLLDALTRLGACAISVSGSGCPPVTVRGPIEGGRTHIDCSLSSQYLSALLLIGPCTEKGLEIEVTQGPVSRPYVDMTIAVMEDFGVRVVREGYGLFQVPGSTPYLAGHHRVEPDASQAGYFWAAGAVTGATVGVEGIGPRSRQGDVSFSRLLEQMGCIVREEDGHLKVTGGPLRAIDADMADMPDMVPTLAVVAAFARGTTRIRNVAHLKAKESDRLASVVRELRRMGIEADCDDAGMTIRGGTPKPADIETHQDHRLAMSFAVAGLRTPGLVITGASCVEKSFPHFWRVLDDLCG